MTKSVVIVNDNARITGGADKIAITSAVALARQGYAVHLLSAVGPVDPDLLQVPNLTIHCTDQYELLHDPNRLRAAIQGIWNIKSQRLAEELFDGLSPLTTVVHVHLWAKALSSSVVRAATQRGFSVVCTLHDYLLACPAGTLFDHPQQAICLRRPMSADCILANCDSRNYADKLWRVGRQAVQSTFGGLPTELSDVIAISDLVISVLSPYLPSSVVVHRLSNFVDVQPLPPAPVESNTDFVFVGRLVKEKGPLLFADAAMKEHLPAIFLGDGELRAEIMKLSPNALVSGWLPYAETLDRLRHARAMVFPSRWYEAQPLVVLEALAQGVPCIVADTSAAREMIVHGETGLLFRGGDVDDLRQKLRLLTDDNFAEHLGKNAHTQYWAQPRTVEKHVSGLALIYAEMLTRKKIAHH